MENQKEVVVDGYRYLVQHPQVETAWEIGVELVKMIGGSAASMAQAGEGKDQAASALIQAVTLLLQKIEPGKSMLLMKRVLANIEVQGKDGEDKKKFMLNDSGVKTHFHGRLGSMMRLTGEAIAFTHSDFFDAIADGVATMMTKASAKIAA